MANNTSSPNRQYPSFYEKFVPIAITVLVIIILGMLGFTIAVGIGIIQF